MSVKFTDNSVKIIGAIDAAAKAFLTEVGSEIAAKAASGSRVETGQLKGSWTYNLKGDTAVEIGSPLENAIWEEYGTGIYAEHGGGRKDPWFYVDASGQGHRTSGKKPNKTLRKAYTAGKSKIESRAAQIFKGEVG